MVEAARVNPWSDENFDEDVENKRRVRRRMRTGMRRRWGEGEGGGAAGGNPWSDEECQGVLGGTIATSGGEYALIPTLIPLNNDENMMTMI